jgi:RNAse (barnase) inhibitor barstar
MSKPVFEIDGGACDTLDHFFNEIGRTLATAPWGRNLDAFNDILRGGFGTPEGGFVLRWKDSDVSRRSLGYPETIRYLEAKAQRCHPTNVPGVLNELEAARRGEGQTVFDMVVEIIRDHGPGGDQADDGVELVLVSSR